KTIGRFRRRSRQFQSAVAIEAVGLSLTTEGVWRVTGACQRPFLLVAPDILSHYQDLYRGVVADPGVDTLEILFGPAQFCRVHFSASRGAKVDVPGIARRRSGIGKPVCPRSHQKLLLRARLGGHGSPAQTAVVRQSAVEEDVVP